MGERGKQQDRENMEERERKRNSRGQNGGVIEEAERERERQRERKREREQMIAWNERGIEGGGRGGDKENRDGRGSE